MLPLYEAKMFHQFDHRWATYIDPDVRDVTMLEKADHVFAVLPRYWVAENSVDERLENNWDTHWLLAFRDIARSTDERTMIAAALPRVAVGHTAPIVSSRESLMLMGLWDSLAFDFVARQKVGGTHMTYTYLKQLPILALEVLDQPAPWDESTSIRTWVESRVLRLISTAEDISEALGTQRTSWNDEERAVIRAELDAAFLILLGNSYEDAEYILDSFPIIRRKEWIEHGRFLTKERVLAAYTALTNLSEGLALQTPSPSSAEGVLS